MSSNQPTLTEPPTTVAVNLSRGRFSVTQLVSFSFYMIAFLELLRHFDPQVSGFGELLPATVFVQLGNAPHSASFSHFFSKAVLWTVVIGNGLRYYLSFWIVELDDSFLKFRQQILSEGWRRIEWSLRASGLISLYLIQFSLTQPRHKWLEPLLVFFYLVLVLWDYQMLNHIPNETDYVSLRSRLRFWLGTELIGLIACVLYCFLCRYYFDNADFLIFFLGSLSAVFVFIIVAEIWVHKDDYFSGKRFVLVLGGTVAISVFMFYRICNNPSQRLGDCGAVHSTQAVSSVTQHAVTGKTPDR